MDASTGTWTQADWKHEHKNKVKKVKTTHQTHCRGRQAGVATTGIVTSIYSDGLDLELSCSRSGDLANRG